MSFFCIFVLMMRIFCIFFLLMAMAGVKAQLPYQNSKLSAEERAADLLSRMTLEEKVDQISMTGLHDFTQSDRCYGVCDSPFDGLELMVR